MNHKIPAHYKCRSDDCLLNAITKSIGIKAEANKKAISGVSLNATKTEWKLLTV